MQSTTAGCAIIPYSLSEVCWRRASLFIDVAYTIQDYIENENGRLEREQQFWSKEIVVKIEYKYCPNLTIIDTPGVHMDHMTFPMGYAC